MDASASERRPFGRPRGRAGRHGLRGNTARANPGVVLSGTFSSMEAGWTNRRDLDEWRGAGRVGEDYMPSTEQMTRMQESARAVRSAWGTVRNRHGQGRSPVDAPARKVERMCASPGMARASFEAMFRIDVRPILPTITVPTLVIHGRQDPIPVQYGRYLADHIAGARYLEVEGNSFIVDERHDPDRD